MIRRCPACAEDISLKADQCKYCGEAVPPEKDPRPARGPVPAKTATRAPREISQARPTPPDIEFLDEPARSCAWENPNRGVASRWWATWRESNFHPTRFFENLPRNTGHRWPVGFANGLWAQVLFVAVVIATGALGVAAVQGHPIEPWVLWLGVGAVVVGIPVYFLLVTTGLYIGAFLWHILLSLMGAKGGFEGTLRVVAYSSGTQVWNVVPILGPVVSVLLKGVLYYQGFRHVHGLSKARAFVATVLPLALMVGAVVALVAVGASQHSAPHAVPGPQESF
jgi:hypothetical protein